MKGAFSHQRPALYAKFFYCFKSRVKSKVTIKKNLLILGKTCYCYKILFGTMKKRLLLRDKLVTIKKKTY